jgi:hypothetical protein
MKILAIGDFHGTFQNKFYKIIDKEKVDAVISLGDYPPFHYRKLWFKHCYGKDVQLWEVIGKKKNKELVKEDLRRTEKALKSLNELHIPVFTVLGNIDYPPDDVTDFWNEKKHKIPKWDRKEPFLSMLKKYKNIQRFDYSYAKFGNYVLIGMRGHSMPGKVKSKAFRKHKKILDKIFYKFRKENKESKVIFVSHNIANKTKLDMISIKALNFAIKNYKRDNKNAKIKGGRYGSKDRHYGSKMARKIIDQYHPVLSLGGHIHEGMGKQRLGRTMLVNPGSAHEGQAAVIELDEGKVKSVKFIR